MYETNNERLYQELEKFIATKLRPFSLLQLLDEEQRLEYAKLNTEERLNYINNIWERKHYTHGKDSENFVHFPQLTNHEICHEMFSNAFRGLSRMFIQMPNLNLEENKFEKYLDIDTTVMHTEEEVFTLSCTLLTLQMLDYDIMMFTAMDDQNDEEYRNAATKHYRPYFFNYVAEIDMKKYKKLQELQRWQEHFESNIILPDEQDKSYIWLECTFNPLTNKSLADFNGYVVQSASSIDKIKIDLSIIEDNDAAAEVKKRILKAYKLNHACMNDEYFIQELDKEIAGELDSLSSIYVYRIGNGNCVYAENKQKDKGFFFDIGFNYRHRPKMLSANSTYNYSSAMKKILAKDPSFFILSHWDLDHIVGSFAARKNFLNKKWFAPDCYDACITAQRLAKYLDLKGNLFRVERKKAGRMIGTVPIGTSIYKLFMGEKVPCDRSSPNCEGIVIEYNGTTNKGTNTVLMMGDVNYSSFNHAIASTNNGQQSFANTNIDYLIVPHHGSEHTGFNLITNNTKPPKGTAIICCTDVKTDNRPNDSHRDVLKTRFAEVFTTESDAKTTDYIEIQL